MQETRRHILDILKIRGEATIDEIVSDLCDRRNRPITPVTVRHHLSILEREGLIEMPQLLRRSSPGRPQHVYALTEQAVAQFPSNYQRLATGLLQRLRTELPDDRINVILEGVADDMALEANVPEGPIEERLDAVVGYLNDHGYEAAWEPAEAGYVLHTYNCPYHALAQETHDLCTMDMRLISTMIGRVPRLMHRVADGNASCSYFIPLKSDDLQVK